MHLPLIAAKVLATVLLVVGATAQASDALLIGGARSDLRITRFLFDGVVREVQLADSADRSVECAPNDFVRWGIPSNDHPTSKVMLQDGSAIAVGPVWDDKGVVKFDADTVSILRHGDWLSTPKEKVKALYFTPKRRDSKSGGEETDTIFLRNGDLLIGQLLSLSGEKARIEAYGQELETPLERITDIHFASQDFQPSGEGCWIGLDDGTLAIASRVAISKTKAKFKTLSGVVVDASADSIVFVQPEGDHVRYLSDREPADYRHTPYFDLQRSYARDKGLDNEPLGCQGSYWVKGLAMHSASRLVYKLEGDEHRFQAEVGVADPAANQHARGSVVFNVYLLRGGEFQLAFDSGVVRGGDSLQRVDVDLNGATALALVVDYADQGDSGDQALWLDARFIKP